MRRFSLVLFFFICGSASASPNFQHIFQQDLYIKKNKCGDVHLGYPRAIRFEIQVPKKIIEQKLMINFSEENSQFSQKIVYDRETFYYPSLFGKDGHYEYGLPYCRGDKNNCYFSFFIFDIGHLYPKKDWRVNLSIHENAPGGREVYREQTQIRNDFLENFQRFSFTGIDVKLNGSRGLIVGYVDPRKILEFLNEGYEVNFVFSWRNSINQVSYSEELHRIDISHEWLRKNTFEFPMKDQAKGPKTYLSFMVYMLKGDKSFESKIVILDKKDAFFNRCEN